MFHTIECEELRDGDPSRTSTIQYDSNMRDRFSGNRESIDEGCEDDDRCPMLIIVHDGNIEFRFQAFLDLETSRCGNIFKINTSESIGNIFYGRDKCFNILGTDNNRKSVNTSELPEEQTFSLHHWHTRTMSEITETEYRRTIRNDCYGSRLERVVIEFFRILGNRATWLSNSRRICPREIVSILYQEQ